MRAVSLVFLLVGAVLFLLPLLRDQLPFDVPIAPADAANAGPIIAGIGFLLLAMTLIRR